VIRHILSRVLRDVHEAMTCGPTAAFERVRFRCNLYVPQAGGVVL